MPAIERKITIDGDGSVLSIEDAGYPFLGSSGNTEIHVVRGKSTPKGFVPNPGQKSPFAKHAIKMRAYGRRASERMQGP